MDRIEEELREFWEKAWGPDMKPPIDGMHPKCLCAKIMNDVVGVNSNKYRYQDRDAANAMLEQVERAFQEVGVIKVSTPPIIGPDGKVVVQRVVSSEDLIRCAAFTKQLEEKGGLKNWARSVLQPPSEPQLTEEEKRRAPGAPNGLKKVPAPTNRPYPHTLMQSAVLM